jgi:alpha-tubulin suppressor-like RCC1 family protein
MAVKQDGTLVGWGYNGYGQLGIGNTTDQAFAITTQFTGTIKSVGMGYFHTVVVKDDGSVWSVGRNNYGQLGDGTVTPNKTSPVQIYPPGSGFVAASAGDSHSAVLKSDGTVWTWGRNTYGQLGDGTITDRSVPEKALALNNVVELAIDGNWSMARRNDGTIWTWGYDYNGELGNGPAVLPYYNPACYCQTNPRRVPGVSQILGIGTGENHGAAVVGTISTPIFGFEAQSLDFGFGQVGQATGSHGLVISNTGTTTLTITGAAISGGNNLEFAVTGPAFPFNISPGATATLNLSFTAGGTGIRNSNVTVSSTAPDSPQTLPLSGFGVTNLPSAGAVIDWGYNAQGQLGNNSTTSSSTPVAPQGLPAPVISVSGGNEYSLALLADGSVWAWGYNNHGAIGNGLINSVIYTNPVKTNIKGVIALASGGYHALALKSDGSVWAWGYGGNGTLGYGLTINTGTPQPVLNTDFSAVKGVKAIAAGNDFSLLLKNDGTVWAFGSNNYGQLGLGNTSSRYNPVQVPLSGTVTAVSAGGYHSLALKSDGTVLAWGRNDYGQLGDGSSTINRTTAVPVAGLSNITGLGAGGFHSLAVKNDGTAWAWGLNDNAQLGTGNIINQNTPVQIPTLRGIAGLYGSYKSSMALKQDGTIWTWGQNQYNELGDGGVNNPNYHNGCACKVNPERQPGTGQVVSAAYGYYHGIAVTGSITRPVYSAEASLDFGKQPLNQTSVVRYLVISNTGQSSFQINSVSITGANAPNFGLQAATLPLIVPAGGSVSLGVTFTPDALNSRKATMSVYGNMVEGYQDIPLSGYGIAGTLPAGSVKAWGQGTSGELGNGKVTSSNVYTSVNTLGNVVKIASGDNHSIALLSDGTVWGWGQNHLGQLGLGNLNTPISVPVQILNLKGIIDIAAADDHSYAIRSDGTLFGWGENADYELGQGHTTNKNRPVPLLNSDLSIFKDAALVMAGTTHSYLQKQDGSWWAWAKNQYGQLGLGNFNNQPHPVLFNTLPGVTAIVPGDFHTVALVGQTVYAWGLNTSGQVGNGGTGNVSSPVQVSSMTGVKAIGAGLSHSLSVKNDGTVWAWGENANGQVTIGTTDALVPVQVGGLAGVTAVTGGGGHSYALKGDGTVWAWGANGNGQLGRGNFTNSNGVPVQVIGLTGAGQVTANNNSGLALIAESIARIGFSPASLQFINTAINTPSQSRVVTLTNTGSSALTVSSITIGGQNPTDFSLTVNTSLPKTLNPGEFFTVSLIFNTPAAGQRKATMVVTDNAPDSPQNYSLTGFVDPSTLNWNWVDAQALTLAPDGSGNLVTTVDQFISQPDGSKWFKVTAGINSRVAISISSANGTATLPADYDLAVYKDLAVSYQQEILPKSLVEIATKAAPYQFLPYQFLPYQFLPYQFLPYQFLPYQFLPYQFLPYQFLPSDKMGESHLPFSMIGDTKIPNGYQPEYYNTVIRDGLLSLSMRDGLSPEQTSFNTFNNTGDLYIRVRSAAGATSIENPFRLQVVVQGGSCAAVTPVPANIPNPTAIPGNYKTVILTDLSRISGTSQEKSTMLTKLNLLANRPEVNGIVLDLSDSTRYQRVISANLQADSNRDCPFAKNIVAQEIKKVVDLYRTGSLQYVVLTGPDSVIPFVRYPDKAGFAPESDFVPVLKSGYPAQAALKNNQYLGQDAYGAKQDILFTNNDLPVADLAVGRLVESAAEVTTMVDAYTLANGVVSPQSALATGYDFVSDVAVAVKGEFEGIMNPPNCGGSCKTTETLIQGYQGTGNWTATELRNKLLGNRHDLVFLAGHFSPGYALAADNNTSFSTTELNASSLNLTNVILMSVGCHSGYNIPGEDSIAGQSEEPDWAQTLNRKGITGIIGTGYQYGDTELIDYSERLYLNMVQQMRLQPPNGLSGMPLGMAFQQAKKLYLSRTSPVNSLHTKVVLEATLYGLPMLQVSAGGINTVSDPSIAGTPTTVGSGPGQALGLATTDYTLTPNLTTKTVNLTNAQNNSQVVATYLTGKDNVVMNGLDPVLPLDTRNAGAANYVLRGVGFRGGNYSDISNIFPLTAGTATEYGRSRVIFQSNTLYPSQPWSINYKEAEAGGNPRLNVIPAQYRSSSPGSDTGILRQFNNMDFRLFYSNYSGVAARAGAPEVKDIKAIASGGTVTFSATVTGPVSAGIQAVWVTYTIEGSGVWQSIDLTSAGNGNWSGNLPLNGQDYAGIRYIVQAVNGVGVVSLSTNSGQLYTPTPPPPPPPPAPLVTSVTILQAPGTIDYLSSPVISAEVKFTDPNTNNQQPLAGVPVIFEVGDQRTAVTSDASGQVWLNYNGQNPFQIKQSPGSRSLNVNYAGNSSYAPSLSSAGFTINKIPTSITLNNTGLNTVQYSDPLSITATLRDINNNPVGLKWLVFVGVDGNNNTFTYSAQTNSNGVAQLLTPQWPAGVYSYTAYFAGQIPGFGTLSDSLYGSSSQAGVTTITIGAENSAVSYIGPATLNASAAILTGKVTQEADNWPGNLSLAQIKFDLYDSGDQLVRTITTTTAGDGVGSATIQGLAAGNYNLRMTVTGGFFSSTTAGPVALTIIDPAACLTVNQSEDTGTGACGTLSGAISAANSITGMNPVTITLSGITNLNVKAAQAKINNSNGARIVLQGTCSANQPVTTLVQASPYTGDGLVLGDKVTLSCIKISGFSGYGLVVEGKNNELDRTQIEKSGRSQMKIVAGGNIKARPTGSPGNNRFIKE